MLSPDARAWLLRVGGSLLIGALAGGMAYLLARAIGTTYLFYQQQQFLREVASLVRSGSIEELANSNIREMRQLFTQLDAQYNQVSARVGFAVAAAAAALGYVWLERRDR